MGDGLKKVARLCDDRIAKLESELEATLSALRDLHDFAERSHHYRYADRSSRAFAVALELLDKHDA